MIIIIIIIIIIVITTTKMKMTISNIVIEVIRTVFIFVFFNERYFKCKKHKEKHLINIHLDNIHKKTQVDMCLSI